MTRQITRVQTKNGRIMTRQITRSAWQAFYVDDNGEPLPLRVVESLDERTAKDECAKINSDWYQASEVE